MSDAPSADRVRADDVVLTDTQGIRALAHPARLTAAERLFSEEAPLTATELARLAGVTPSAMSYHLRALERHGLVVRAEAGADDRQRPWRAAGRRLVVRRDRSAGPGARAAVDLLVGEMLARLTSSLAELSDRLPDEPEHWRIGGLTPATAHLDAGQARALDAELQATIERYVELGRRPGPGTRPVSITLAVVPEGPVPDSPVPDSPVPDSAVPDSAVPDSPVPDETA